MPRPWLQHRGRAPSTGRRAAAGEPGARAGAESLRAKPPEALEVILLLSRCRFTSVFCGLCTLPRSSLAGATVGLTSGCSRSPQATPCPHPGTITGLFCPPQRSPVLLTDSSCSSGSPFLSPGQSGLPSCCTLTGVSSSHTGSCCFSHVWP